MKKERRIIGCIVSLNYQGNSHELKQITLETFSNDRINLTKNKILIPSLSEPEASSHELLNPEFIEIENSNDFRETFQEAANFGHGLALILDLEAKKIASLVILPNQCSREQLAQLQGPTGDPGYCIPGYNCPGD